MTLLEKLCTAVKHAAVGYVFLHVHINLGTLDILPDWACYWFVLSAIDKLKDWRASAGLLRPLCLGLGCWEMLCWLLKLLGAVPAWFTPLATVAAVIGLYFHFQLLTELASLARDFGCPQDRRLLILRTVRTLLATFLALPLPWAELEVLGYLSVIVMIVVCIWLCGTLFSLKHSLEDVRTEPGSDL